MTSAPLDPLIGLTLNERYLIRSRIARGGMAMVYLATDLRLERKVAVKVMHEHLAEDENFTRRFDREARSAAALSHENLVNVFDQGQDLGRVYLVMEYLPSITLRDLLKKQQRLTLDQSLEISEAILAGLSAAHAAGIVHRDLKPENVLLVDDGRIKIGDFGLARAVSANTTTGQALLGTIAYLSPELVTRGIADKRSDLYAFGIMVYEMLTGEQPFTGDQPMQIAYQHAHSDVPAPSARSEVSTPAVDEFVRWLTQRDADLRPADAGEAYDALRAVSRDPYALTRVIPPQTAGDLAATSVLTTADLGDPELTGAGANAATTLLAATSALPPATSQPPSDDTAQVAPIPPSAPDRMRLQGMRRAKRGRITAALLAVLIAGTGLTGFWFGQGPGAKVIIPQVAGNTMESVATELAQLELLMDATECSSLEVDSGLAVHTDPSAGTRVERGTTVTVCQSTGPEMLPVPTLIGLSLTDATDLIDESRFTFGQVVDTRFADADVNTVLAALDQDDAPLGNTFPERGTIDLVVSAGPLPSVTGMSVEKATKTLGDLGLTVDLTLNVEAHDPDMETGHVLALLPSTDPVRPGDSVGLQISLGPELFEIPDVSGLGLQAAMDALFQAGFSPTTLVPEALRGLAIATGTNPSAGTPVEAGTEIRITSQLSL